MKALLLAILREIARLAMSESGELLSTRRKAHLLQHEMYTRLAGEAAVKPRAAASHLAPAHRRTATRSKRQQPSTTAPLFTS